MPAVMQATDHSESMHASRQRGDPRQGHAESRRQPALRHPLETLPTEIWMTIIELVDDDCFVWFVLRRVSRFLRYIADGFLATWVFRHTSLRFNGDYVRKIMLYLPHLAATSPLSFYFMPVRIAPPDTRDKLVLKLQEQLEEYPVKRMSNSSWGPFGHRSALCFCPVKVAKTADIARCNCLADVFFAQDDEHRNRLAHDSHFIRMGNDLRSRPIPGVAMDAETQELSIDWRSLCETVYDDELRIRRAQSPWVRYMRAGHNPDQVLIEKECLETFNLPGLKLGQAIREDGWIFWDSTPEPGDWYSFQLGSNGNVEYHFPTID